MVSRGCFETDPNLIGIQDWIQDPVGNELGNTELINTNIMLLYNTVILVAFKLLKVTAERIRIRSWIRIR
jgi:hypothetical protein